MSKETINITDTIAEGRDYVETHYRKKEGVICPCCDSFVKAYWRSLNCGMARALILIYNKWDLHYFHVEEYLKKCDCPASVRGDFHKLRFWGFIQRKEVVRDDGSPRNGHYKITQKGIQFVLGNERAVKKILIYNNRPLAYGDVKISISEALGSKFDYSELMNAGRT